MCRGNAIEQSHTTARQRNVYVPPVIAVVSSLHQPLLREPVDKPHNTVMTELQTFGKCTDRHTTHIRISTNSEQCLMLLRRQAHVRGSFLTNAKELPQCVAEGRKGLIIGLRNPVCHTTNLNASTIDPRGRGV